MSILFHRIQIYISNNYYHNIVSWACDFLIFLIWGVRRCLMTPSISRPQIFDEMERNQAGERRRKNIK